MKLLPYLRDGFMVAGAGLITYGVWQLHPPSAFIVGGGLLLAVGLAGALRA